MTKDSSFNQQLQQLESEIKALKARLPGIHLTKSAEQDYDLKSQIIEKQNKMIELLMELSEKNAKL